MGTSEPGSHEVPPPLPPSEHVSHKNVICKAGVVFSVSMKCTCAGAGVGAGAVCSV